MNHKITFPEIFETQTLPPPARDARLKLEFMIKNDHVPEAVSCMEDCLSGQKPELAEAVKPWHVRELVFSEVNGIGSHRQRSYLEFDLLEKLLKLKPRGDDQDLINAFKNAKLEGIEDAFRHRTGTESPNYKTMLDAIKRHESFFSYPTALIAARIGVFAGVTALKEEAESPGCLNPDIFKTWFANVVREAQAEPALLLEVRKASMGQDAPEGQPARPARNPGPR